MSGMLCRKWLPEVWNLWTSSKSRFPPLWCFGMSLLKLCSLSVGLCVFSFFHGKLYAALSASTQPPINFDPTWKSWADIILLSTVTLSVPTYTRVNATLYTELNWTEQYFINTQMEIESWFRLPPPCFTTALLPHHLFFVPSLEIFLDITWAFQNLSCKLSSCHGYSS